MPGGVVKADFELPGLQFQDPLQVLGVFAGLSDALPSVRIAGNDPDRLGRTKTAIGQEGIHALHVLPRGEIGIVKYREGKLFAFRPDAMVNHGAVYLAYWAHNWRTTATTCSHSSACMSGNRGSVTSFGHWADATGRCSVCQA